MAERRWVELVPLTAGLLSLAAAALVLLHRSGAAEVDGLVVLGSAWLVVGAVGLGAVLRHLLGRADVSAGPQPPD